MCPLKALNAEKLGDSDLCLILCEDIYKISQAGQKGKPGEETVIDGGLPGQGPDVSLSHTSEVGVKAPVYSGTAQGDCSG